MSTDPSEEKCLKLRSGSSLGRWCWLQGPSHSVFQVPRLTRIPKCYREVTVLREASPSTLIDLVGSLRRRDLYGLSLKGLCGRLLNGHRVSSERTQKIWVLILFIFHYRSQKGRSFFPVLCFPRYYGVLFRFYGRHKTIFRRGGNDHKNSTLYCVSVHSLFIFEIDQ